EQPRQCDPVGQRDAGGAPQRPCKAQGDERDRQQRGGACRDPLHEQLVAEDSREAGEATGPQQPGLPAPGERGRRFAGVGRQRRRGWRHRAHATSAPRRMAAGHSMARTPMHAETKPVTELHVVILAAGEGKRMKSSLPKVLQKVAGRPMLAHVVDAARALSPAAIHVVHGHGGEPVIPAVADPADLRWVEQSEQLGTGHAVREAMPGVPDGAQVLVLYGDVPLITAETLRRLLAVDSRLSVLVAELENPRGYGRIVRDSEGNVGAVVEEKDADAEQRRIGIVNTGVLAAESTALKNWLQRLSSDNAQGEYYLTDVFAMAAAEYSAAEIVFVDDPVETEG